MTNSTRRRWRQRRRHVRWITVFILGHQRKSKSAGLVTGKGTFDWHPQCVFSLRLSLMSKQKQKKLKKSLRLRLELNDQNCNLYPNIFILCFYYNCTSSFCDTADWLLQMNSCQSILFAWSDDATDTFIAKPTVAKKRRHSPVQSHQSNSISIPIVYFFALYCSCFAHISQIFDLA